jgi:hypothetical protein
MSRAIFLASVILITVANSPAANAAEGDTVINIAVTVRTDRVRPEPSTGFSTPKWSFVLHKDKTVTDTYDSTGDRPLKETNLRKLGGKNEGRFEVLGPDHLRRHSAGKTFTQQIDVFIKGPTCTAAYEMKLKPGFKEFELYSPQLGKTAYYRVIAMESATCEIK